MIAGPYWVDVVLNEFKKTLGPLDSSIPIAAIRMAIEKHCPFKTDTAYEEVYRQHYLCYSESQTVARACRDRLNELDKLDVSVMVPGIQQLVAQERQNLINVIARLEGKR